MCDLDFYNAFAQSPIENENKSGPFGGSRGAVFGERAFSSFLLLLPPYPMRDAKEEKSSGQPSARGGRYWNSSYSKNGGDGGKRCGWGRKDPSLWRTRWGWKLCRGSEEICILVLPGEFMLSLRFRRNERKRKVLLFLADALLYTLKRGERERVEFQAVINSAAAFPPPLLTPAPEL